MPIEIVTQFDDLVERVLHLGTKLLGPHVFGDGVVGGVGEDLNF